MSGELALLLTTCHSGEESEPDIATEQSMLTIFIATVFKDDAAVRQRWYVALETGARVMVQLWSL